MLEDSYLHARLFIEESLLKATPTFKLPDLIKLHTSRFSALCVHLEKRVHSANFKNRLLSQSAYNDKKEVILVFNQDVGEAISVAAEAILKKTDNFKDGFEGNSQESLLPFISCVIHFLSATFSDIKYCKKPCYPQAVIRFTPLFKTGKILCRLITQHNLYLFTLAW